MLCKSCDVEIVQDAGSVFNTGREGNGGGGQKKGEWLCRREEGIYNRVPAVWFISCVLLVNERKTAQPSSSITTKHLMNEEPRDGI